MPRLFLLPSLVLLALFVSGCCTFLYPYTCNNIDAIARECGTCPVGMTYRSDLQTCVSCSPDAPCPTSAVSAPPRVGGGVGTDVNTDGLVVQVAAEVSLRPIALEAGLEVGRASEDGYEIPEGLLRSAAVGSVSQDYTVIQSYLHGKYPFPVMGGRARVYPLAGLRYLRYAASDCEEGPGIDCVFNEFTLDLGAGVGYGIFSVEAYTGLIGDVPDLSLRARALFPLGGGR